MIRKKRRKEKKINIINLIILDMKKNSRKFKIIDYNNFNNNYIATYIFTFLIILNLFIRTKSNKLDFYYFKYSKISLKIKGKATNSLLGNSGIYTFKGINYIKEVYINGNKQDKVAYRYYFNQTDNFVELIFDENINSCEFMFFSCTKITEINLSNFDSSQVTSIYDMFAFCSSLTSLNLSNFNTSKVKCMNSMFAFCSSLTLLDLSNFNTSNVTDMYFIVWLLFIFKFFRFI